jgi:hypothetical protein
MALKRHEGKEMVFVASEYFERFGVSRQVIEYRRASKQVQPIGMVKGVFLYYKLDADFQVIRYWLNSFRRFISEWEKTKLIREDAENRRNEAQEKFNQSTGQERAWWADEHNELESDAKYGASSREYYELVQLLQEYRLNKAVIKLKGIGPLDPRLNISDEIDDFLFRVCAYAGSGLSLNEYLKREKPISAKSSDYFDVLVHFFKRIGKPINTGIAYEIREILFNSL